MTGWSQEAMVGDRRPNVIGDRNKSEISNNIKIRLNIQFNIQGFQ